MEEEIALLLKARELVLRGALFVCVSLDTAAWILTLPRSQRLKDEVIEFLDGEESVREWLNLGITEISRTYQIAIIDTMLARRGVKV